MKKVMTILGFLLFASFILKSCIANTKDSNKLKLGLNKVELNDTTKLNKAKSFLIEKKEKQVVKEVKFLIENSKDLDNPSSDISLIYGEKISKIATITGHASIIDKNEYPNQGIPKNAISACGAWWAGSGDYFYIIPSEKGIIIYQGWQDEMQEDSGFHWKKLKEINNKVSK